MVRSASGATPGISSRFRQLLRFDPEADIDPAETTLANIVRVEGVVGLALSVFVALLLPVFLADSLPQLFREHLPMYALSVTSIAAPFYLLPRWAGKRLEENPPILWPAVLAGIPAAVYEGPLWLVIFPVRLYLAIKIYRHYAALAAWRSSTHKAR